MDLSVGTRLLRYGHLVAGADAYERELLDTFDEAQCDGLGRAVDAQEQRMRRESFPQNEKAPRCRASRRAGATGLEPATSGVTAGRRPSGTCKLRQSVTRNYLHFRLF
jgi:hypothetical protein